MKTSSVPSAKQIAVWMHVNPQRAAGFQTGFQTCCIADFQVG
jgi:hypothetical protein